MEEKVSRFGVVCSLSFIFFSFLGRMLFPFGDEPDFYTRASKLVLEPNLKWTPYHIFRHYYKEMHFFSLCNTNSDVLSLWSEIELNTCDEPYQQKLIRFYLLVIISLPLLFVFCFRALSYRFLSKMKLDLTFSEFSEKLDVLALTFTFSGVIYYYGVFASEQLVLLLSLLIYLFWKNKLIVLIICGFIFNLDLGNFLVVLFFISYAVFSNSLNSFPKLKFAFRVLLILLALNLGYSILPYLDKISIIGEKASSIFDKSQNYNFREKYPVILRPVITFMTSIFMTPSGVKVVLVFIAYIFVIIKSIKKLSLNAKLGKFKSDYDLSLSALTTVLFFVYLFPDYANAKYYVFLLPFLLKIFANIYNKYTILSFVAIMNVIIFVNLYLYRI